MPACLTLTMAVHAWMRAPLAVPHSTTVVHSFSLASVQCRRSERLQLHAYAETHATLHVCCHGLHPCSNVRASAHGHAAGTGPSSCRGQR
jgi:hypothetical protein